MPAYTTPQATQPANHAAEAPPLAPETQDETSRYMARLEAYLADLPPAERLPALKSLRTWWISEYERWTFRVDQGVATATDLKSNASDFVCTIAELGARLEREKNAAADAVPAHAQDGFRPEAS